VSKTEAASLKNSAAKAPMEPNKTSVEVIVKRLSEAPSDKRFVLKDGRVLKNMVELANALEYMADDIFNHHVNPYRNDFRNWISDVLGEKDLASTLDKIKGKNETQLAVLKYIVKKAF
jgi:hypothetical protein